MAKAGRKTNKSKRNLKMNKNFTKVLLLLGATTLYLALFTNDKEIIKEVEQVQEQLEPTIIELEPSTVIDQHTYRMTSYYTNDSTGSGKCTGSGLCVSDFKVNENGWYTYNGMIVMAGATNECLNSHTGACNSYNNIVVGRIYFDYYDTFAVVIDNIEYDAIILDSCGASMYVAENRIDLFVAGSNHFIDRGYKGVNPVQLYIERVIR